MPNNIRVLLVEDEPFVRDEIETIIRDTISLELYRSAATYPEALGFLFDEYDLLLVDKALPGGGSGIDLVRQLNELPHHKRILMMTVFDDQKSVTDAIEAGADGYFVKQDPNIVDAIFSVMNFANPISPSVTKFLMAKVTKSLNADVKLTDREQDTLQALADGLKYYEIADRLAVSKHTVPDYIKTLYRKLGVNDKSSAVYAGMQKGLLRAK